MSKVTVKQLFDNFGLQIFEQLKWGEKPSYSHGAVYVVSTSDNPNRNVNGPEVPEFDEEAIKQWLTNSPELRIHKMVSPHFDQFRTALFPFWHSKENILYIGYEKYFKTEMGKFYRHKIGGAKPHSDGQWLKILKDHDKLNIYNAVCENPQLVQAKLLKRFADLLSGKSYDQIDKPRKYLPFANVDQKLAEQGGFQNMYT